MVAVLLILAGCSDDSGSAGSMATVQQPAGEQMISGEISSQRDAINNGYFLETAEEFGPDGSLYSSIRYTIDYAENTLTANDLLINSQPIDHIYVYDDNGDLSNSTFFITDEQFGSGQELLRVDFIRGVGGRLEEGRVEFLFGVESDSITMFNYSDDGSLASFSTTYAETFELEEGIFASETVTGEYTYDAENQLTSLQETDREFPNVPFDTTFTTSNGRILSTQTIAENSSFAFNETASYQYDSFGNITSIEYSSASGALTRRSVYTYSAASEAVANLNLMSLFFN